MPAGPSGPNVTAAGPSDPSSTPAGASSTGASSTGASSTGASSTGASLTRRPAPEPAPPGAAQPRPPLSSPLVGSVANGRSEGARLSTAPDPAAVAGVAAGVLALATMVAAGFRARSRLGRLR